MHTLRQTVWPIVAGLAAAFIVMLVFEYVNSFFFPIPEGLDTSDPSAIRAFTASLPSVAYILVLLGWLLGSLVAGSITTHLSGEKVYSRSFAVGVILTALGVINNLAIGHPVLFSVVALPLFILGTYFGHRYVARASELHAATQ